MTRIRSSSRLLAITAVAVALLTTVLGRTPLQAATSEPLRIGSLTIVDAYKQSDPLTHGDAKTQFSVKLPDPPTCPGDSANDQWRVETYLIPSSEDPVQIKYGAIGPDPYGNGHYALFGIDTTPYVFGLTMRNPMKGQPGKIEPFPPFSMEVIAGEDLPNGQYRVGVACTFFGVTKQYWDTQIIVSDSKKGSLEWRLADQPASVLHSDDGSGTPTLVIALVVAGALVATVVWFRRRSAHRAPAVTVSKQSLAKESS